MVITNGRRNDRGICWVIRENKKHPSVKGLDNIIYNVEKKKAGGLVLRQERCFEDDFGQHLRLRGADKKRKEQICEDMNAL